MIFDFSCFHRTAVEMTVYTVTNLLLQQQPKTEKRGATPQCWSAEFEKCPSRSPGPVRLLLQLYNEVIRVKFKKYFNLIYTHSIFCYLLYFW